MLGWWNPLLLDVPEERALLPPADDEYVYALSTRIDSVC